MARRRLRVYPTAEPHAVPAPAASVSVLLSDLLPLIGSAHREGFVWLDDFLDDEVLVTQDLYDVLQAFRAVRPSA